MVLLAREAWWQARLFFRNPLLVLTTIAMPLLLVPLLHELNPDAVVPVATDAGMWAFSTSNVGVLYSGSAIQGPFVPYDQYLVPALGVFGVVAACFAGLALRVTVAREEGVLKRMRGLPVPLWVHLGGRVAAAVLVGWAVMVAVVALGVVLYDVDVLGDRLVGLAAVVALISACFCALGLAVTIVLASREAAPAVVLAILIPAAFLSHVFYPPHLAPAWMRSAARWLPLEPAARLTTGAFNPFQPEGWIDRGSVARLAAWTVVGALLVAFFFRWTPSAERSRGGVRPGRVLAIAAAVVLVAAGAAFAAGRGEGSTEGTVAVGELADLPPGGAVQLDVVGPPWGPVVAARSEGGDVAFFATSRACALRPVDAVASDWMAGAGLAAPGAALADVCRPALYSAEGRCLDGDCGSDLVRLAAQRDGDGWSVDPTQLITPDGVLPDPAPAPVRRTIVYRAAEEGVGAVWDAQGLEIVSDHALRLETQGSSGGALTGLAVDGVSYGMTTVQLLSLPVGASDGQQHAPVTVERPARNTWLVHVDLGDGPGTIRLVALDGAVPEGRLQVEVDLSMPGVGRLQQNVELTPIAGVT